MFPAAPASPGSGNTTTDPADPGATTIPYSVAMSPTAHNLRAGSVITNDNVHLYYEQAGSGHPLILIHDFAASRKYFGPNFGDLAANFKVIRYDQRGHGDSAKPPFGFHLHRLAADLQDIIRHLSLPRVAILGVGLGSSVMWAFIEIYGDSQISALIFVDQSPYQMASPDGTWIGSKRIISEGSIAHTSSELRNNRRAFLEANVLDGFSRPLTSSEAGPYVNEGLKASSSFLSQLIANHYRMDWRAVLPLVSCPAMVIVGKKSKLFHMEAIAFAANNMPRGLLVPFENGSHFLYIEQATYFNNIVTAYLQAAVTFV